MSMSQSIWSYLSHRAEAMATTGLRDLRTLEDWQRVRPTLHAEFMQSLGLAPLPPRCDLKVTEYGSFAGSGYRARKIAFQILPDCWASANVYYPDPGSGDATASAAPGVLYVCGHAPLGVFRYQPHGIMWARRGYVCLIVDTIEQSDNPGEHHGLWMGRQDHWLSLGYTATTGELWNSIRALDVLLQDPAVDPQRVGVTGVSGGGALSFFLATVDDRVKAVSTLCGLSSQVDAICNRHLMGNCDCFYPLNVAPRDISVYAALIAPRPAVFCFAEHDQLFHIDEVRATIDRTREIYRLHGVEERCQLVTCPGPHGDHPEFDEATARVFDEYVAGVKGPEVPRGKRDHEEAAISVFQGQPPTPNHLHLLPDLLCPVGTVPLPEGQADWPTIRTRALGRLMERVPGLNPARRGAGQLEVTGNDTCWGTVNRMRTHRGQIEGMDIWMHAVFAPDRPDKLVISLAGEGETAMHALSRVGAGIDPATTGYGAFEPRMAGFSAPASLPYVHPAGSSFTPARSFLLRAMALVGLTPVMMNIHDLGLAVDTLLEQPETRNRELYLHGKGDGAIAVLYRALLDERIAGVLLEDLPSTHREGGPIPGVLRAFDLPQAVGLMAPRKVALVSAGHNNWNWPRRVYDRLGCTRHLSMSDSLRAGFAKLLG